MNTVSLHTTPLLLVVEDLLNSLLHIIALLPVTNLHESKWSVAARLSKDSHFGKNDGRGKKFSTCLKEYFNILVITLI